jgi:IclR family transcriptional regulator, acetate operon repressor
VAQDSAHGKRPEYPIASVDNALTLLTLLGEREQLRVAEAAAELGTARSTAHRLLAMLEYHGFAGRDAATKAYVPGPALLGAGLGALGGLDLRSLARPVLERLAERTGETVHLALLRAGDIVFLDSVESTATLRISSRVGRVMPACCTAAGKAILARLRAEELHRLYPDGRLPRMTERSLETLDQLQAELEEVRDAGYARNFGESEAEVAAIAVALPDPLGRRASVTVSAPLMRLRRGGTGPLAETVREAVAGLGAAKRV